MATRTTLYLDQDIVERMRQFVPPRGLSQLVNELLEQRVTQLERAALEDQMREGYITTRRERQELNEDWSVVDVEGWPE